MSFGRHILKLLRLFGYGEPDVLPKPDPRTVRGRSDGLQVSAGRVKTP